MHAIYKAVWADCGLVGVNWPRCKILTVDKSVENSYNVVYIAEDPRYFLFLKYFRNGFKDYYRIITRIITFGLGSREYNYFKSECL